MRCVVKALSNSKTVEAVIMTLVDSLLCSPQNLSGGTDAAKVAAASTPHRLEPVYID